MTGISEPRVHIPAHGAAAAAGGSFQRLLVPVDPYGRAAPALALAAQFSAVAGSHLRLVHVRMWDPPIRGAARFFPETSEEATALLDQALTGLWNLGATASGVVVDAERSRAAAAIAAEARSWGADAMVVARRPRRALGVLLLGSLSDRVIRAASCPVLVVRTRT